MIGQYFWLIMTVAVMAWYSTITIYVAIRGAFDVRHMLERLGEGRDRDLKRET